MRPGRKQSLPLSTPHEKSSTAEIHQIDDDAWDLNTRAANDTDLMAGDGAANVRRCAKAYEIVLYHTYQRGTEEMFCTKIDGRAYAMPVVYEFTAAEIEAAFDLAGGMCECCGKTLSWSNSRASGGRGQWER
jgi:hypothetical protein